LANWLYERRRPARWYTWPRDESLASLAARVRVVT